MSLKNVLCLIAYAICVLGMINCGNSKYADANIFIIRQNYSPKGILGLINNLKGKQMKELSLLVNDIKESKAFGYRYYYGYGYGYGYSYGYNYKYSGKYYQEEWEKKS